ncbi:hypothetical protein BDR06DRAFT_356414 [Suillus hirtellus]|nr:hypothetical protein BDR06DRAFT_356414 [Suillus hirtellus]
MITRFTYATLHSMSLLRLVSVHIKSRPLMIFYILTQLVVLLRGASDNRYLLYLGRKDLRLQSTHSNLFLFASANFFTSLVART